MNEEKRIKFKERSQMEAKRLNNISFKEYITIEKESDTKHEFHDGTIFAMAGGTVEHGLISGNTLIELGLPNWVRGRANSAILP